ncbi:hypothetical protein [Pedobacter antarcticus]|uniref:hypothetical protein n=1 Tax=Pedobacter antarcticus TaxID=34086 RepID=UPI00292F3D18|nr:hypothetical protein [Pedobacter antarcticus]
MSVSLSTAPPNFAFSADLIKVRFACQNYLSRAAEKSVNTVPISGTAEVTLKYNGYTIVMTPTDAPDDSGTQYLKNGPLSTILDNFGSNFYLNQDFNLQVSGSNLVLTAKAAGPAFDISGYNSVKGSSEKIKQNYSIAFRLFCEKIDNSGFELIYEASQPLLYSEPGYAEVPIGDKLHEHIGKELRSSYPEYPDRNYVNCTKSCRRYYFEFAESYEGQTHKVKKSPFYTILHGGLSYVSQFNSTLQSLIAPAAPSADRFLKQGHTTVYTRTNQPQYLYFFNTREIFQSKLQIKATYKDGSTATKDIYPGELYGFKKYAFDITFNKVIAPLFDTAKVITKYQVQLMSVAGPRSEIRTYILNYEYRSYVRYFLNWSSFGSFDTRLCYGKGNSEFELSQKEVSRMLSQGYDIKQGESYAYDLSTKSSYKVATGWMNKRELLFNRDFFLSAFKYRYSNGLMLPIRIDSKTIPEIQDGNNLYSQTFEYSYQFSDHSYTEGDQEDSGESFGDFFFSSGYVSNPTQSGVEIDPTVPAWVKAITFQDIEKWNQISVNDARFITIAGDQIFTYSKGLNPVPDKTEVVITALEHNFEAIDIDRKWEWYDGHNWQQITGSFGKTLTVNHQSYIFQGSQSATIRYRVNDLSDQMTIVKLYSGSGSLSVVITSAFGDIFMNGNIDTVLYANVYYGGENITSTVPDSGFTWSRTSDDSYEDNIWNSRHGKHVREIDIDETDVVKKATFNCDVEVIINN